MDTIAVEFPKARSVIDSSQVAILPALPGSDDPRINAVDPVFIPRLVVNLPADEGVLGGINRSMTQDVSDNGSVGVSAYVLPWSEMHLGDKCAVYAHYVGETTSVTLAEVDVKASQVNQIIPVTLLANLLRDGVCEIYVSVTRISGNNQDSPSLSVLVKTTLPGGLPPAVLSAPQVSADIRKNGVTQDVLPTGVEVTVDRYLNMRKNSLISLFWGLVRLEQTVTPAMVGQPTVFLVTRATIVQGGDSENLAVFYSLTDVVGNPSAQNSLQLILEVNTQLNLLESPIVDAANEKGEVDLPELGNNDALVIVSSRQVSFTPEDKVHLRWIGVAPNGREYRHEETWIPTSTTRSHDFFVPHSLVYLIADGQALVSWSLERAGTVRESRKVCVTIKGEAFRHPAPSVPEAPGDLLPSSAPSAQVRLAPILGAREGDVVRLFWEGTRPDGTRHDYIGQRTLNKDMLDKPVFFDINSMDIQPLARGTVKVYYILYSDGAQPVTSYELNLYVDVAVERLAAPTVPKAPGGILIPESAPEGTVGVIEPYADMRPLDKIRFWSIGNSVQMSEYGELTLSQESVGKPVEFPISKELIAKNLGAVIWLVYTVTNPVDRNRRISARLSLTIRAALLVPDIQSIRDGNNAVIRPGGTSYTQVLTLSGSRSPNTAVEILDNGTVIATVPSGASGQWTSAALSVAVGRHIFTVRTPGSAQQSTAIQITILLPNPVVINQLIDGNNVSIGNGGNTLSNRVTLKGRATPGGQVEILLNSTPRQVITADARGDWQYSISGLAYALHTFVARPLPAGTPESAPWRVNVRREWEDHFASLADYNYRGWLPHVGARSGWIRDFIMNNQRVTAFFNFTGDSGSPNGFAGTVLYQDFLLIPGHYQFTFEAVHIADRPDPKLLNPILSTEISLPGWPGDRRVVPKNGIWYLFLLAFYVYERQYVRFHIYNHQDGSDGNDFGIRNVKIVRNNTEGGIMNAPAPKPEYPSIKLFEGPPRS